MNSLLIEPFSGLSGDMLNGLLIDLGSNEDLLNKELSKLHLPEFKVKVQKKSKSSISGSDFDVALLTHDIKDEGLSDLYKHVHEHHHYEHTHHHHDNPEIRNLKDIEKIIEDSDLSNFVKMHSKNVFEDIAIAESNVHNISKDEIHFHEVGATDSIVDIISFFILFEQLNIGDVYSAPVVDGSGFIKVAHGMMPVPVPAVMQLRKNTNIRYKQDYDIKTELVTPTGLAIFKELSPNFNIPEELKLIKTGYGFGKRDTGKLNALRGSLVTLKHSKDSVKKDNDEILKIELNIDDQTPEQIGYVCNLLLDNGALDVFSTNIHMKKNRSAILLTVLCEIEDRDKFVYLLMKNTTSFGMRMSNLKRVKMIRDFRKLPTKWGNLQFKVGHYKDIKKVSVEYDDCAKIARENNISITEVYNTLQKYEEKF